VINNGGVIAYPTEAVYGLGCSPVFQASVQRILRLKRRRISKGLILVGADIAQFRHLVDMDKLQNKDEILATWPGPVTWILPARPSVPGWLTGDHRGLAVRISAHPVVRQLCENAGILISTSANPAGCKPARNASRVRTYFGSTLDYILPGTVGRLAAPTEIRDAVSGKILRSSR
jgi:L-threonylcarbamoyladenylate synthase